jgi:hypothetical protein
VDSGIVPDEADLSKTPLLVHPEQRTCQLASLMSANAKSPAWVFVATLGMALCALGFALTFS